MDQQVLGQGPVEPPHEEDTESKAVSHDDDVGLVAEAPSVDIPDEVVLVDRDAVIDIRPTFSVRESIEKPAKPKTVVFFPLLSFEILRRGNS